MSCSLPPHHRQRVRPGRCWAGLAALFFGGLFVLTLGSHVARAASAADYRRLADSAVTGKQYARAATLYRQEAQIYRSRGDVNAAKVEEMKADRWSTRIQVFADVPANPAALGALYSHAKFEPVYGCYLGAYVASDDSLPAGSETMGNAIYAERAGALGDRLHKHLATSWDYCSYGADFPLNWARALVAQGIAPHVAWEPNQGLEAVQDDDYLQGFARDAAACGGPVFLRFAGEMNGDWTAWHRDPALYQAKFRLVHDVMARIAPNVAMIWCLNSIPEYNMDDYYPGDAYVDWVGVNFYSVIHHDNDPARPAWFENPADLLQYVYHHYAWRKPIAICEYGASHREKLDPAKDYSDVAALKIAQLFSALPREFPRVKLVGIFDCDNLTARHIVPGRQLNDYSVTDSPTVFAALTKAVAPDYFLPDVIPTRQTVFPGRLRELQPGMTLSGLVPLSAWVQSYDQHPTVIYSLDGKELARENTPGDYGFDLDTSRWSPGKHRLAVDVVDSAGQKAGRMEVPVLFSPSPKPPPKPNLHPTRHGPRISPVPGTHPTSVPGIPPAAPEEEKQAKYVGIGLVAFAALFCLLRLFLAIRPRGKRKP